MSLKIRNSELSVMEEAELVLHLQQEHQKKHHEDLPLDSKLRSEVHELRVNQHLVHSPLREETTVQYPREQHQNQT
jgi:hypothetical protein